MLFCSYRLLSYLLCPLVQQRKTFIGIWHYTYTCFHSMQNVNNVEFCLKISLFGSKSVLERKWFRIWNSTGKECNKPLKLNKDYMHV